MPSAQVAGVTSKGKQESLASSVSTATAGGGEAQTSNDAAISQLLAGQRSMEARQCMAEEKLEMISSSLGAIQKAIEQMQMNQNLSV